VRRRPLRLSADALAQEADAFAHDRRRGHRARSRRGAGAGNRRPRHCRPPSTRCRAVLVRRHLRLHRRSVPTGTYDFKHAQFGEGTAAKFDKAAFTGADVIFDWATFTGREVTFDGATFTSGQVTFDWATFTGGKVEFIAATFTGGKVTFDGATFNSGRVDLTGAEFITGKVTFDAAAFTSDEVTRDGAEFRGWPPPAPAAGAAPAVCRIKGKLWSGLSVSSTSLRYIKRHVMEAFSLSVSPNLTRPARPMTGVRCWVRADLFGWALVGERTYWEVVMRGAGSRAKSIKAGTLGRIGQIAGDEGCPSKVSSRRIDQASSGR